MKCEQCGIDTHVNNELSKVNLTAGWAKHQLGILIEMIQDRQETGGIPVSESFLVSELQRIKDGISLLQ